MITFITCMPCRYRALSDIQGTKGPLLGPFSRWQDITVNNLDTVDVAGSLNTSDSDYQRLRSLVGYNEGATPWGVAPF
jgi:hypothetical protein